MSGKVGWPASPGLPQSAGRARQSAFWRASGQKCCLAWLNFQRGGPLSKRVASHLRPPTVPYRHPFRFLSYLHLSMLLPPPLSLSPLLFHSLNLARPVSPVPLPPLSRESSSIHIARLLPLPRSRFGAFPDTCTIYSNNARAFWSYPRWKLNVALLLYDSYKRDHRSRFLVIETILIVESWSCSRRGRDREPVSLGLNDIYLGANHATVRLFVGMRGNANGEAARQDQRHSYWTRRKRWIFMPPCRGEHRRQQGAKRR